MQTRRFGFTNIDYTLLEEKSQWIEYICEVDGQWLKSFLIVPDDAEYTEVKRLITKG